MNVRAKWQLLPKFNQEGQSRCLCSTWTACGDSVDDSDVTRLEDPETLVKEIYQNLAYDFMEQEGHSEDYTEATNLEKRAMREWMKEYTDQLPEYNYLLDELLG